MNNKWSKFIIINRIINWYFNLSLLFYFFNRATDFKYFPNDLTTYNFVLSIGIILGFTICKKIIKKALEE